MDHSATVYMIGRSMLLPILVASRSLAPLADALLGEWLISLESSPESVPYTIEFHTSDPANPSLLNATLWRNDLPPSPRFALRDTPLLAALQFSFSADGTAQIPSTDPPTVISIVDDTLSATFNGTKVTADRTRDSFAIRYGGIAYAMSRDAASSARAVKRQAASHAIGATVVLPSENGLNVSGIGAKVQQFFVAGAIVIGAVAVLLSVVKALRSAGRSEAVKPTDESKEKVE
jgi:hypothetical protein